MTRNRLSQPLRLFGLFVFTCLVLQTLAPAAAEPSSSLVAPATPEEKPLLKRRPAPSLNLPPPDLLVRRPAEPLKIVIPNMNEAKQIRVAAAPAAPTAQGAGRAKKPKAVDYYRLGYTPVPPPMNTFGRRNPIIATVLAPLVDAGISLANAVPITPPTMIAYIPPPPSVQMAALDTISIPETEQPAIASPEFIEAKPIVTKTRIASPPLVVKREKIHVPAPASAAVSPEEKLAAFGSLVPSAGASEAGVTPLIPIPQEPAPAVVPIPAPPAALSDANAVPSPAEILNSDKRGLAAAPSPVQAQPQLDDMMDSTHTKKLSASKKSGMSTADNGPKLTAPVVTPLIVPIPAPPSTASASPVTSPTTDPMIEGDLSAESKQIVDKVPSGIDKPKHKPSKLDVQRAKDTEYVSKPAGAESNDQAAAPSGESVSTKEAMGIKIAVKKPGVDLNYELEKAYNAVVSGQSDQAIQIYKTILANDPKNKLALFGLATTYHRAGLINLARPLYGELLKIDPDNRDALNNFLVLLSEESPEEALQQLGKLQERNPYFSPIPAQMAIIYQKLGSSELAINMMNQAVALAPENLTYQYNLAIMLDKMHKYDEAMPIYRRLVEAYLKGEKIPGNPQKIQERLTFISSNRR